LSGLNISYEEVLRLTVRRKNELLATLKELRDKEIAVIKKATKK
jgi:hypothetical protein